MQRKKRLENFKSLEQFIAMYTQELETIKTLVYNAKVTRYETEKVDGGRRTSEDVLISLIEQKEKMEGLIKDYKTLRDEIIEDIKKIEKVEYRTVLYKKHIENITLKDIARQMGYSYDHIRRLHREALKKLDG